MKKLEKGIATFYKGLDHVLDILLVVMFAAFTILLSADILRRFIFGSSIIWAQEVAKYIFTWLVYFGAASVFSKSGHLAVDVVLNKFKPAIKWWLSFLFYLIMIAFLCVVTWTGISYASLNFEKPLYSAPFGNYGIVYMGLPIGCILMILNIVRELYRMLTFKGEYFAYKEENA